MTSTPIKVLLIAGRSGVGKTTVSYEVSEQLRIHDVAHALVDGDNLDAVYPQPTGSDLTEANLAAIWRNYRSLGHDKLIYVNTMSVLSSQWIERALGEELDLTGILLTATDSVAGERLANRAIGSTFEVHLERSAAAAVHLEASAGDWVHRVPTDDRSVKDIAQSVVRLTGWVPASSS